MTDRTAALVVETATVPNAHGVASQTVVALPPSDLDEVGEMRVMIDGHEVVEQYDPAMPQP